MVDEVFESVSALGCGRQPEPVAGGYSVEHVEECARRDVVAFVDDHESVAGGQFVDLVAARQGRQQCDIEDAGRFGPSAADLSAFESEVLL